MEPKDQFYGASSKVLDPGHEWLLGTHIEDVTPEEMQRRWTGNVAVAKQSPALRLKFGKYRRLRFTGLCRSKGNASMVRETTDWLHPDAIEIISYHACV
jgi:hypothetical protein